MALVDDLVVTLNRQRLHLNSTVGTFYDVIALYSLLQDLFDEIGGSALAGSMAYPTPMSAQTPTDYTLKDGWYLTQSSYKNLKGGSISTSGLDSNIYLLTLNSAGYTNAVAGDIGKTVQNSGATITGILLDYDNTARKWWVRKTVGTFTNALAVTIASGTGAGTTASSGGVLTGEDLAANAYTVGTLNHGTTYFIQNGVTIDGTGWYGNSNAAGNHIDILIKVKESGVTIASGIVTFLNRVNRDAANTLDGATTGDTYDWFQANLSGGGRTPVPLNTKADLADTLTNTAAANWMNGTSGSIAIATGSYSADVNQDGSNEAYVGRVDHNGRANSIVYSVLKYFFRKGNTANVGATSTPAEQFLYLNASYNVVKDAPAASYAAPKIFYARGWYPINLAAADASNYQTIGTGSATPIDPPVFYTRSRTGVPVGAKVIVARRSALNFLLTNEFTLAAGNNSGNGTLVLSASVPVDKPLSGFVRVFDNSGNEDRYAYTSYSGATLTLSGTLSKTYGTGNNAYIPYIDTTAGSSTVSVVTRYVADRDVTGFVRLGSGASKMTGDVQNYTLTAADSSVPVTVIADTINQN